jgi:hypothetical protein
VSKREDILDGRVKDNWKENSGLLYTCNAGLLDLEGVKTYSGLTGTISSVLSGVFQCDNI